MRNGRTSAVILFCVGTKDAQSGAGDPLETQWRAGPSGVFRRGAVAQPGGPPGGLLPTTARRAFWPYTIRL